MFQTLLTALREGLEASLVVGIIVAYLVKTGRRDRLSAVWAGAGVASVLSLVIGAVLTFTSHALSFEAQETFGGVMSAVAVVLVTSMVFWMKRNAHRLKDDLQAKVDGAVHLGWLSVFLMAFVTVGREGLETALFLWPTVEAAGSGASPLVGALVGLILAIVLGWLVYRRSVHLNLAVFFRITGAALIVVAAGVLAYGVHDLQEAGILPGLNSLAFDVSEQIPPSSWYGTLLKGTLNFSPATTWLEASTYLGYLIPTMWLFLRTPRPRARQAAIAGAVLAVSMTACGAGGGARVAVAGTDDSCAPELTQLAAGKTTFVFTNKAGQTNELYILRQDDSIVGEVENVSPGTKRNLSADLAAGEYFLVCKPGQKGDGLRTEIQVSGEGGQKALVPDRTVTLKGSTYAFAFDAPLTISKGEIIRFEMLNGATDMAHEMEVFGPDGEPIGEIGPTAPGQTGTVTLEFAEPGTYRFVCGIEGHEAKGMVLEVQVVEG